MELKRIFWLTALHISNTAALYFSALNLLEAMPPEQAAHVFAQTHKAPEDLNGVGWYFPAVVEALKELQG